METLDVRPTLEKLEEDWRALQEVRKSYLDRAERRGVP